MSVYEPREDSYLLQKYVKKFARGLVLDMGTGTGIQAETAGRRRLVKKVLGADVNSSAITYAQNVSKNEKVSYIKSNLFSRVPKNEFDTIIFNPPYLPADKRETKADARALAGGKQGHEIIAAFIKDAPCYLKKNGNILLIFSSLTNRGLVEKSIDQAGLTFKELESKKFFMETLFCYLIEWNPIILAVKRRGVKDIAYFTHGKRGVVFTGRYRGKKVAVKIKKRTSEAQNRIAHEAKWLHLLNKHKIAPKLRIKGKHFVVYDFVYGQLIPEFIEKHDAPAIRKVIADVFHQCFKLDQLKVNKEEMHQPVKHIVVHNSKATLLDFERTHKTKSPKNVTQFVQFLCAMEAVLIHKGFYFNIFTLRRLAKKYKQYMDLAHLHHLVNEFQ